MRSLSWILCGAPALITAATISLEPSVDSEAQSEPSDPSYRALVRYTVCEDGSNYPSKRRLPSNQKHDVFPPSNVLSFAPSSFLHPTSSFLSALHPLEGFSALESRDGGATRCASTCGLLLMVTNDPLLWKGKKVKSKVYKSPCVCLCVCVGGQCLCAG